MDDVVTWATGFDSANPGFRIAGRQLNAFMRDLPVSRWLDLHHHLISPWKFDLGTIVQRNSDMLQRRAAR